MNRHYNPTSKALHSVFVAAAVLATVLVAGSIEGLVGYYAGAQASSTPPTVLAQR
jgi:hypothetical protein